MVRTSAVRTNADPSGGCRWLSSSSSFRPNSAVVSVAVFSVRPSVTSSDTRYASPRSIGSSKIRVCGGSPSTLLSLRCPGPHALPPPAPICPSGLPVRYRARTFYTTAHLSPGARRGAARAAVRSPACPIARTYRRCRTAPEIAGLDPGVHLRARGRPRPCRSPYRTAPRPGRARSARCRRSSAYRRWPGPTYRSPPPRSSTCH